MYVAAAFFFLWVIYCLVTEVFLVKSVSLREFIGFFVLLTLTLGLVNAYWIYPQSMRLKHSAELKPLSSYKESVEESLKERSKYTSLLNVIRFQAAWTWHEDYEDDPYVLYSEFYKKNNFFVFLSFIPVLFGLMAVFRLRKNKYTAFFITLSLLGIIFSVGLHAPFYALTRFLIKYIPGFWMIRTPWYKWTLFTTMGVSVLIYMVLSSLNIRYKNTDKRMLPNLGALVLSLCILVYASPVLGGKMFTTKEERHYIPPNYIDIPEYVQEAADWLNSQNDYFRVMVLHSVSRRISEWGYAGYEPILAYFTNKPIITPIMQASFGSPYVIPNFNNYLYSWLYVDKYHDNEKVKRKYINEQDSAFIASKILPLFNIKYLLHEGDLRWDFYDRYESPEFVANKLRLQKGVSLDKTFGKWSFYKLNTQLPHSYLTDKVNLVIGDISSYEALSRTHILEYNNVFEHQLSKALHEKLYNESLINKLIYVNKDALPAHDKASSYLLLDTDNDELFFKKEIKDEAASKELSLQYIKGSYDEAGQGSISFKDASNSIELEVDLKSRKSRRINLKLEAFSKNKDRFIDVYFNGRIIEKYSCRANRNTLIKLEALKLEPGNNMLEFKAGGQVLDKQLTLKKEVQAYVYEYNTNIFLEEALRGRIYLYPKPLDEIDYLPNKIVLRENDSDISLSYDKSNMQYASGIYNMSKGNKALGFIQYQDEGYYLLIAPAKHTSSKIKPLDEEGLSPVYFQAAADEYQSQWKFLFFLESFDKFWQADLKEAHHKESTYQTHFIANGYANGWLLDGQQKVGHRLTIMLKYSAQRQFWAGLTASTLGILLCLIGLIASGLKSKKNTGNEYKKGI
jgi:hypothetical protein